MNFRYARGAPKPVTPQNRGDPEAKKHVFCLFRIRPRTLVAGYLHSVDSFTQSAVLNLDLGCAQKNEQILKKFVKVNFFYLGRKNQGKNGQKRDLFPSLL
jgi:hypothetical protein